VRAELGRFGPQAGMAELVERWPEAVGAEIARFAWPARIARDGTVHVSTADSVWAFELGHRAAEIGARLGGVQLRFAPGPLPESSVPPAADVVVPSDEDDARAGELTAAMTHAELRETVQKALSFALARGRSGPPF
jgi:hypothetical protein